MEESQSSSDFKRNKKARWDARAQRKNCHNRKLKVNGFENRPNSRLIFSRSKTTREKMRLIVIYCALVHLTHAFMADWLIEFLELVEKTSFTEQEIEHWYKVSIFE